MTSKLLPMQERLLDGLHRDTMALAEEAQSYFADMQGYYADVQGGRSNPDPVARTTCSIECLKVTTRLMHVVAWVMMRRSVENGETTSAQAHSIERRLGASPSSDERDVDVLPTRARSFVERSIAIHRRASHLEAATTSDFAELGLVHP